MNDLIPVHVGLMGHIDHGKTALARVLSEGVFTAGLDKHPQSRKRGITIDLGFTMFRLDRFLVTLVDAPGHADLIRSVVAGANIIDAAILTVAADEGPKIQTGEHIIILRSMGIETIIVVITKIDLVNEEQIEKVESQVRGILQELDFKTTRFVRVSAKTKEGVNALRLALLQSLSPQERSVNGSFLMPIDHAFHVKGHGTVTTGTILRGHIHLGETVHLMPQDKLARVRTIQTFGNARQHARAGDRVGINIPEINPKGITRGNYLCRPNSLSIGSVFLIRVKQNPLYRRKITEGMIINAHIGMAEVTCKVFPVIRENNRQVAIQAVKGNEFTLILHSQKLIASEKGTKVLLLRTDLGPTEMRIIGHGVVEEINKTYGVYRRRRRTGSIKRIREKDVLVAGLALHKETAQRLKGLRVMTDDGVSGVIKSPFGTKGVVIVSFAKPVVEGHSVYLDTYIEEKI